VVGDVGTTVGVRGDVAVVVLAGTDVVVAEMGTAGVDVDVGDGDGVRVGGADGVGVSGGVGVDVGVWIASRVGFWVGGIGISVAGGVAAVVAGDRAGAVLTDSPECSGFAMARAVIVTGTSTVAPALSLVGPPYRPIGPRTGLPCWSTQKAQPAGAGGQDAAGRQRRGGRHLAVGGSGHSGGVLNRLTYPPRRAA
jgi:hypothetical protein